jgi:hypothetical protein
LAISSIMDKSAEGGGASSPVTETLATETDRETGFADSAIATATGVLALVMASAAGQGGANRGQRPAGTH